MKRLVFGFAALLYLTSCTGNGNKQTEAPQTPASDSIVQTEETPQHPEPARKDSIHPETVKEEKMVELDINLFVSPFKEEGFPGKGLDLKSDKQISKVLVNLGFSENKSVRTRTEEICGEMETWKSTKYTFTKTVGDKTIIVENEDEVEIIFPDSELKDKFVNSAIKAGYKKSENYTDRAGTFYTDPTDCYYRGSDIIVQGNKVFIIERSEC